MASAAIATTHSQPTRLLRKKKVLERVPYSDTTLWRRVKDGSFPAPIRISANAVAWRESDIERWIAEKAERRAVTD